MFKKDGAKSRTKIKRKRRIETWENYIYLYITSSKSKKKHRTFTRNDILSKKYISLYCVDVMSISFHFREEQKKATWQSYHILPKDTNALLMQTCIQEEREINRILTNISRNWFSFNVTLLKRLYKFIEIQYWFIGWLVD